MKNFMEKYLKKDWKIYVGGIVFAIVFTVILVALDFSLRNLYSLFIFTAGSIGVFLFIGYILLATFKSRINILEANDKISREFAKEINAYLNNVEFRYVLSFFLVFLLYGFSVFKLYIIVVLLLVYILICNVIIFIRFLQFKNTTEENIYN